MKIRTIGQAAGSVRNFPSRIYSGEQLEACKQLGPEIRRVRSLLCVLQRQDFLGASATLWDIHSIIKPPVFAVLYALGENRMCHV